MTPCPDRSSAKAILESYRDVLRDLTELAETERHLLESGQHPLPAPLVDRKETLVQDYALLTNAIRQWAADLMAAGLLNPEEIDARVRRLVALTKDNQRRLNAFKVRTAERVERVMQRLALSDTAPGCQTPAAVAPSVNGAVPRPPLRP